MIQCIVCGATAKRDSAAGWIAVLDAYFCPECIPDPPPEGADDATD